MLEQLRAAWEKLEPRQRVTLSVTVVGTLIGLALVGFWSSRPTYSVLYSGLAPEDAAAVVEELRSTKVPYRLAGSGGRIEVPTPALYETRLSLAAKGMPSRSTIGFELFDRSTLPGTDFSNAVNLQRALQGELSRTISSLTEVKSARMHLSMPRESLYAEATPPTASVLLDLGAKGSLHKEQVRGIAYLVASAVQNLTFKNVTVVDTLGNVLHGGGSGGPDFGDSTLATAKAFSEALTARLQTMLDAMFGPYKTIVRAQAELDMDAEESSEERVDPVSEDPTSAVSREHTAEETYSGGGATGGGVSGVPANIMGRAGTASTEQQGSYKSEEQTREYQFSKKTTHKKRQPGRVTRLTVAAVVDESIAAEGIQRVKEVLEAAAGVDPTRGDSIVVRPMKLNAAELAEEEDKLAGAAQAAQQRQAVIEMLLQRGLPAVIVVVLLAIMVRTASELRRAASEAPRDEGEAVGGAGGPALATAQAPPAEAEEASEATAEFDALKREEEELAAELQRIAQEQPDVLAEELRNLVNTQESE